MKIKITNASFLQKTIILGVFFLSFFIFFASTGEKAKAENYVCQAKFTGAGGRINYLSYAGLTTKESCEAENGKTDRQYSWVTESEFNKNKATDWGGQKEQYFNNVDNAPSYCGFSALTPTGLVLCLLGTVFWFVKLILITAASLFTWIIDAKNIAYVLNQQSAIYTAWKLIRDLLNMVFILVLLFSAFCTIFQVSKYNYKKILLTLVIMALLVNFSFPIARVIIDASNVMMYSIIKTQLSDPGGTFVAITGDSHLGNIINTKYTTPGAMLTAIVFVFILAITLLAIAILLVVRTVALAVIIIFSPLGFVGNIMPGFESYASKWWDNLFKYAFFGPIMMLGLSIAMSIMSAMANINKANPITEAAAKIAGTSIDINLLGAMAYFAIPIVILWMTMGLAQSMSIAGAGAIMGAAQKALKWSGKHLTGFSLAKAGAGAGAHWVNRKLAETKGLRYLSPMAMKDAWKRRTERADRKALSISSGKIQNTLNKAIGTMASANPFVGISRFIKGRRAGTGGLKNVFKPKDIDTTDYDFIEHRRFVNEEKKRIKDTNESAGYVLHEMQNAILRNEPGDSAIVAAAQDLLAEKNDNNEYGYDKGMTTNPQKIKISQIRDLRAVGVTKSPNVVKSLMSTGNVAFNSGGYSYGGTGKFIRKGTPDAIDTRTHIDYSNFRTLEELDQVDANGGTAIVNPHLNQEFESDFYFTTEQEQAEIGAAKFSNVEPQTRQRTTHPDAFYEIDSNGTVIAMHKGGEETFKKLNSGDIDNAHRARDASQRHWQAYNKYNTDPTFKAQVDALGPIAAAYMRRAWEVVQNESPSTAWHP